MRVGRQLPVISSPLGVPIACVRQTIPSTERGDVLMFVSGVAEIASVADRLAVYAGETRRWIVLPLHRCGHNPVPPRFPGPYLLACARTRSPVPWLTPPCGTAVVCPWRSRIVCLLQLRLECASASSPRMVACCLVVMAAVVMLLPGGNAFWCRRAAPVTLSSPVVGHAAILRRRLSLLTASGAISPSSP